MNQQKKKGVEKKMKEACWSYGGMGAAISGGVAAIGTWITARLGGWDEALMILVGCMALDFAIGVLAAGKNGQLNSKIAFWGGVNKIVVLFLVAVGVGLDRFLPLKELLHRPGGAFPLGKLRQVRRPPACLFEKPACPAEGLRRPGRERIEEGE